MPDVPSTACLDDDCLLALVEGRLDAQARRRAERHVDACDECRRIAAVLAYENEEATAPSPPPEATEGTETDRRVLPGGLRSRYTLLRQIGSGPHGALFIASDRSRGLVAVKWIHAELAEAEGASTRVREAVRLAQSIQHPNVLRVHGAHADRGALLVVSDIAESGDVAQLLAADDLAPKLVEDVIAQLVSALAHAHKNGVTHGDLKPENVLVDLAGQVLVTDFGLASALSGSEERDPRRADLFAVSRLALGLSDRSRDASRHLRALFKRCHEDPLAFLSAVELETALYPLSQSGSRSRREREWTPKFGDVIGGKYRVEGLLGSGGMGVVMTAREIGSERQVAIKLMPPRTARRRSAVERFLREAQAASSIESEHVVRIFEVGTADDGTPYLVMEHLGGNTLGRLIADRGPLSLHEAIDYVLQACVAVAECHARGIVHRDLKPDNLMVLDEPGRRGSVKVLDFGISKADWFDAADPSRLTATVDVLGTPTYMSPEQVRSSRNVDARTDLWSLGVVLYEALTGRPPFVAHNVPALAAMIVSDDPEPLGQLRSEVPGGLAHVVLQCLAKHPDRRIGSVHHLAERLVPFASPSSLRWVHQVRNIAAADIPRMTPLPSRPVPAPRTLRRDASLLTVPTAAPVFKRPMRGVVAAFVAVALLAGAALGSMLRDSEPALDPPTVAPIAQPAAPTLEPAPAPVEAQKLASPPMIPRALKKQRAPKRRPVGGPLDDRH